MASITSSQTMQTLLKIKNKKEEKIKVQCVVLLLLF